MATFLFHSLNRLALVALLLTGLTASLPSSSLQAAPNTYEEEIIQAQVNQSFQNLLELWREELYFEIHDQGQAKSQTLLSKSTFAQRMVDLNWKPSLKASVLKSIKVDYRNFVRLTVQIEFEHKSRPDKKIEKIYIFHVILENNRWVYPLGTFIRAPFSGFDLEPEKEKAPDQATSDTSTLPAK